MAAFLKQPLGWAFGGLGLLVAAMTAFAVFQPVKVVPRLADAPPVRLTDQRGQVVDNEALAGRIVLFGFGYSHDPTGTLDETLDEMGRFLAQAEAEGMGENVRLALILFDAERDTVERRRQLTAERGLDEEAWLLLGGEADELKGTIGQGFGIYYEAVPLADLLISQPELAARLDAPPAPDGTAFLQARRYVLVDERSIIRAQYRAPLDLDLILRDLRLMARERASSGAGRVVNEAAHLFLCYPS